MKSPTNPDALPPTAGSGCQECGHPDAKPVDICDFCGQPFGHSGDDTNGHNATCIHCGENIYTTRCSECGAEYDEEEELPNDLVDCEGCWTWGIPAADVVTDEAGQDCCPLCDQPYLVSHTGQPSREWGGSGGIQFIPTAVKQQASEGRRPHR